MDLGTVKEKLRLHKYHYAEEFQADIHLIVSNCITFNGPDNKISHQAVALREEFTKKANELGWTFYLR